MPTTTRTSFRTGDWVRVVTRTMARNVGDYLYHDIRFDELLSGSGGLWIRGLGQDGRRYTIPLSNVLRIDPLQEAHA